MIDGYGRAPASTVGSVVLTDLASGRSWEGVDVATVRRAAAAAAGLPLRAARDACCTLLRRPAAGARVPARGSLEERWLHPAPPRAAAPATPPPRPLLALPAHPLPAPAQIHFEPILPASVDALIAEGEVFWCAGGLMVEHALVQPHVTRLEGSLDGVMGLAKDLLLRLLCQVGAAEEAPAA